MREPGPLKILLALLIVCAGGAFFGFYLDTRRSAEESAEKPLEAASEPVLNRALPSRKEAVLEKPLVKMRPVSESRSAEHSLSSEEVAPIEAILSDNRDRAASHAMEETYFAALRVSAREAAPGEEVDIALEFRTGRPTSSLTFAIGYPKESLVVRRIVASPKEYGVLESSNEELGEIGIRFDFKNPFRAFGKVPIAFLRTVLSKASKAGDSFPVRILSASAVDPEGRAFPVTTADGVLTVAGFPGMEVRRASREPPSDEAPWVIAKAPSVEDAGVDESGEVSAAEPTPLPPLEAEATPAREDPPERMLWLSNSAGTAGEKVVVSLYIDSAWEVRGLHFRLNFDPSSLQFLGTQAGPLFDRFLVLDQAEGQTLQVAMLGEAPLGEFRDARVCDLFFVVSDNPTKAHEPMRLGGAHVVSEWGSFRAVARSGWVSIAPAISSNDPSGDPKSVHSVSSRPKESASPKGRTKSPIERRALPNKDSKAAVLAPIDRGDLNFDGSVDAMDLSIFLEFFRGN